MLKGYTILLEVKLSKELKFRAFDTMKAKAAKFDHDNIDTFEDDDREEWRSTPLTK